MEALKKPSVTDLVPSKIAFHYKVLPLAYEDRLVKLAIPPDFPSQYKEELLIMIQKPLEFQEHSREFIEKEIQRIYGVGAAVMDELMEQETVIASETAEAETLDGEIKVASLPALVNELLMDSLKHRASDIHIEPFEKSFRIRYRVDGYLMKANLPQGIEKVAAHFVSRVKIMAKLDIGEKRLPQDGRIKVKTKSGEFDLRVSILPSTYGEAVVIRILKPLDFLSLEELGMSPPMLEKIRKFCQKPHGMMLVTGPTGSGKTTTLYACLREVNQMDRKIITIEDPVEYKVPGIIQMQVNPKIDFTFSRALRSMLRHDPDILMVGEIRDKETAEIAIRSALTGHLVFSTLHTNDAPSAVTRLVEMGIEPYLVASSVEAVLAQRLVRKRCEPCEKCQGSGYFGRVAICEMMAVDEGLRELIFERRPASFLRSHALKHGMISLSQDGMNKVSSGLISVDALHPMILS
ncbi:MAG: type II/IV secretion system protein [Candidatus Omnitrophica bacterium]|nr:type II/IV secretion system protein [Candidatus Omnitrophota bacterium]